MSPFRVPEGSPQTGGARPRCVAPEALRGPRTESVVRCASAFDGSRRQEAPGAAWRLEACIDAQAQERGHFAAPFSTFHAGVPFDIEPTFGWQQQAAFE